MLQKHANIYLSIYTSGVDKKDFLHTRKKHPNLQKRLFRNFKQKNLVIQVLSLLVEKK